MRWQLYDSIGNYMFSQWFFGTVSLQINNYVDTRFEFGKIACIPYADMRARDLKTIHHGLGGPRLDLLA